MSVLLRGAFDDDDDGKGPPPSESDVNANDDARRDSARRCWESLDGHWVANDAMNARIFVQAGEVWREGKACSAKLEKSDKGAVTWQHGTVTWTLKELCATEALWENASNRPIIWTRPFANARVGLEKLTGDWVAQDGAHLDVTLHCVWRDGLRYKPVTVARVQDGGNVTWEDGNKKTWTLDVLNTSSRRLVWEQKESRRVVFWRRQVEEIADLVGVWKASDGAEITVNDAGQITRAGKKMEQGTLEFEANSITFAKRHYMNAQKSTKNVIVWDSGGRTSAQGAVANVEWVREHCLTKGIKETYENVLVYECKDKTWKHWADKVNKHVKDICARKFNKQLAQGEKVEEFRGVKESHVTALLYSAFPETRHWLFVVDSKDSRLGVQGFAIAHDVGMYDDGRRIYLDVVCARPPSAPSLGKPKIKYGELLMNAVEGHARRLGFDVVELAALNVPLVESYYKKRGFVEKDYPAWGQEARYPTFTGLPGQPYDLSDETITSECERRGLDIAGKNMAQIREKLEDHTWLGYRMTKWLANQEAEEPRGASASRKRKLDEEAGGSLLARLSGTGKNGSAKKARVNIDQGPGR